MEWYRLYGVVYVSGICGMVCVEWYMWNGICLEWHIWSGIKIWNGMLND